MKKLHTRIVFHFRYITVSEKSVIFSNLVDLQVKRHINLSKTEGTSAIEKMLKEYISKEESEADLDNDYRNMDDPILGKKGPYKFVDFD